MMRHYGMPASMVLTLMVAGCSSTPNPQEAFAKQQQQLEAKQTERNSKTLADMPAWFLDYQPSDDSGVYAVGASFADDPQAALEDARTLALAEIARNTSARVSAQKSQIQRKDTAGQSKNSSELVVDEFVASQNMAGYKVVKREIKQEGTRFRAYVMLFFPNNRLQNDEVNQLKTSHQALVERVNREQMKTVDLQPTP